MSWIKKALGIKIGPHIFARVNPDHPFGGLDYFSESHDWEMAIRIDGITLDDSRREFCGKVLDWSKITEKQIELLGKKKLKFTIDEVKGLFR
jgi:hypothetical protein